MMVHGDRITGTGFQRGCLSNLAHKTRANWDWCARPLRVLSFFGRLQIRLVRFIYLCKGDLATYCQFFLACTRDERTAKNPVCPCLDTLTTTEGSIADLSAVLVEGLMAHQTILYGILSACWIYVLCCQMKLHLHKSVLELKWAHGRYLIQEGNRIISSYD